MCQKKQGPKGDPVFFVAGVNKGYVVICNAKKPSSKIRTRTQKNQARSERKFQTNWTEDFGKEKGPRQKKRGPKVK